MDKLDQLPPKADTVITPEESEVINQFFGQSSETPLQKANGVDWKLIGYSIVLFVLLANPWIDQILCKIPYCSNNAMFSFGVKLAIFVVVLVILSFFT